MQKLIKYGLLVAIITFGLASIYVVSNGMRLVFDFLKPLTTIFVIALAVLGYKRSFPKYATFIIVALVFSLLGDSFLLRKEYFVFGLGSFLIAHVLFTFAIISIHGFSRNVIPAALLAIFGLFYFYFLSNSLGELKIPVIFYFTAILVMVHQAISLAINHGDSNKFYYFIAAASLLFAFSDSVIAYNMFVNKVTMADFIILSTYWSSITIFAVSIWKVGARE